MDASYKDASLPIDARVDRLLKQMTVQEKVGQMFHNMVVQGPNASLAEANPRFGLEGTKHSVCSRMMTHFNLVGPVLDVETTAKWYNNLQTLALSTRLGIPITLSSDPRNHFNQNIGTSSRAGALSQWPETLGFAALRSPDLVLRFADVARQEYVALGLRCALHPQIDLATEYRWARINGTFGEDADLTSELVKAYVRGFQGEALGPSSVSTMVKHFPGGGPLLDGEESHFTYGRKQVYPGNHFEYHLRPFVAAIETGASQIMPAYGMPTGLDCEEVAFAFNRAMITDLLRKKLKFEGTICTDWGLITDAVILGQDMPARAWGCEDLSELDRVQKLLDAGCDQFGGESCTELVIQLIESGRVPENRLDESVRRILKEKFILGLFDNPFIDVEEAVKVVGNPTFLAEAFDAQMKSITLLINKDHILPIKVSKYRKVYLENLTRSAAEEQGLEVVHNAEEADIAIIRLQAPFEPRLGGFEAMFHAGSLEFSEESKSKIIKLCAKVPTIIDVYLDRPVVLTPVLEAAAVVVNYGSNDDALMEVLTGQVGPQGKLPFDLPSSLEAVAKSRSDVPYDTEKPLLKFGHGLEYSH
jgi:beta-glucosidase